MAQGSKFNFANLNFFSRLNARSRIVVLVVGLAAIIFLVYLGTRLLSGDESTTGPSRVASAPQGLQSVPGGTLTPEYARALQQSGAYNAQQAQISGGSAVPTLINTAGQGGVASCIICSDQSANVKSYLDDWARQGKISPDVAASLQQLADKNGAVDDFASELDRLVREGKLTPEQARQLLEQYKKQHGNALLADSAKTMDDLIKGGKLPLDAANDLLSLQKNGASPSDYAAALQRLVNSGKLSSAAAQQLLSQYTQQRAKEIVAGSIASLRQMARSGEITADVEKDLVDLETRMVAIDTYSAALQKFVTAGKMTPIVSDKILTEFKAQKAAIGTTGTINQLLQNAEDAAYAEIADLLKTGKMSQEVASLLIDMIQKNVSFEEYQSVVNTLVKQNKLTPEIAKLKIEDYRLVKGLRDLAQALGSLQGNNASTGAYGDALRRAVQAGLLSPDQAAQLMQEYQASTVQPVASAPSGPATAAFAQLQQRTQQDVVQQPSGLNTAEFNAAQAKAQQELAQDRQARIEALTTAMSGQAQTLVAAWQPPTMLHKDGITESSSGKKGATTDNKKSR